QHVERQIPGSGALEEVLPLESQHERMLSFDTRCMRTDEIGWMLALHPHQGIVANVADGDRFRIRTEVVDIIEAGHAAIAQYRAMEFLMDAGVAQRQGKEDIDRKIEQRHAGLAPGLVLLSPGALDGAMGGVVKGCAPRECLLHGGSMDAAG